MVAWHSLQFMLTEHSVELETHVMVLSRKIVPPISMGREDQQIYL